MENHFIAIKWCMMNGLLLMNWANCFCLLTEEEIANLENSTY